MKRILSFLFLLVIVISAFAQGGKTWFPDNQLTTVGAYYYPEHCVITSYSIHYTKLYEWRLLPHFVLGAPARFPVVGINSGFPDLGRDE